MKDSKEQDARNRLTQRGISLAGKVLRALPSGGFLVEPQVDRRVPLIMLSGGRRESLPDERLFAVHAKIEG